MELRLTIAKRYLCLPVKTADKENQKLEKLEIFGGGEKLYEWRIPVPAGSGAYCYDYLAYVNVEGCHGRELSIVGEFPPEFFGAVTQKEDYEEPPLVRPEIHFTADRGWINDPNGLVYQEGIYHLYFQYNPFNTEWENMCWGSAVSRDLLHWEQGDTVLWPDENGTAFSGSAIVNERGLLGLPREALICFYTAAGGAGDWSADKDFTQRMAYSLDGGRTFFKLPLPALGPIGHESRDPKVFWHEESGAYVMVLWIRGNEFRIFRSADLENWRQTQALELPGAWECPDLFRVESESGEGRWVFWSADGFYFFGTFDGYVFERMGERFEAYGTKLPYAAQTYSGVGDRVITVPWLKTRNPGRLYRGCMGIPREISLAETGDGPRLAFLPVRELAAAKTLVSTENSCEYREDQAFEIEVEWEPEAAGETVIRLPGQEIRVEPPAGLIRYGDQVCRAAEPLAGISVIVDLGVVEITAAGGIIYLVYESAAYDGCSDSLCAGERLSGKIAVEGDGIRSVALSRIG